MHDNFHDTFIANYVYQRNLDLYTEAEEAYFTYMDNALKCCGGLTNHADGCEYKATGMRNW